MTILYLAIAIYLASWLANVIKLWKYVNFSEAMLLLSMPAVAGYITVKVYFAVLGKLLYDANYRGHAWRKFVIVSYYLVVNIPGIFTAVSVILVKRNRQIKSIKHPYRRTVNQFSERIATNCGEVFA